MYIESDVEDKSVLPHISQVISSTVIHIARFTHSSVNEVLALEKRPEVKNLPNAKRREGKNGEPGKILYAAIRHNCKEERFIKSNVQESKETDDWCLKNVLRAS